MGKKISARNNPLRKKQIQHKNIHKLRFRMDDQIPD